MQNQISKAAGRNDATLLCRGLSLETNTGPVLWFKTQPRHPSTTSQEDPRSPSAFHKCSCFRVDQPRQLWDITRCVLTIWIHLKDGVCLRIPDSQPSHVQKWLRALPCRHLKAGSKHTPCILQGKSIMDGSTVWKKDDLQSPQATLVCYLMSSSILACASRSKGSAE